MNPGSYFFMPEEDYHKDPCDEPSLSRSTILDLVTKTPRHAFENHPRLNPQAEEEQKGIYDIGSAAHSLLLQGIDKAAEVPYDDWRKKEAKDLRDQWRALGHYPLLTKHYTSVVEMVQAAKDFLKNCELEIKSLQDEGQSEVTYIWKDGSVWCRARLDWIQHDKKMVIDYKTTGLLADPATYERNAINTGLDIQDQFYRQGVNSVDGHDPLFVFLIQETQKPYLCSLVQLNEPYHDMAAQKIDRAKRLWLKCLRENNWPAYPLSISIIDPPDWAMAQWEKKMLLEGDAYQKMKWSKERLEAEIG